ncbi:MAG: DNA-3-methyladenine glycosylase I [Rhodospirillaceae bacterium]|nr:DNA-3-methyladenine glycosylase I [Rhodospirillaceae bacterium]
MAARLKQGLIRGEDGHARCFWPGDLPDYLAYHDDEWGLPVADDHRLFEKICLEGFQSGLSWLTILRKRENFRETFSEFDFTRIAKYGKRDVEKLVNNAGIIRHRGKIESTVNNAKKAIEMADEFGSLGAYFWQFETDPANRPKRLDHSTLKTLGKTPESIALSKNLKKRGWSFVGPTTAYAFMQAMGMVNDHIDGCFAHDATEKARKKFKRPT